MRFSYAEAMCDVSHYLPLAQAADDSGWDSMVVPDSIAYPEESDSTYPYTADGNREFLDGKPFIEPFVLIPAMAAVTSRLRFATFVVKLAIRQPVLVAKQAASIAVMSDNRLGFGIGLTHDRIPSATLAEARAHRLPVLEIPYSTPFIAVDRFVADRATLTRRTLGAQATVMMTGRLDARDRDLAGGAVQHDRLRPDGDRPRRVIHQRRQDECVVVAGGDRRVVVHARPEHLHLRAPGRMVADTEAVAAQRDGVRFQHLDRRERPRALVDSLVN